MTTDPYAQFSELSPAVLPELEKLADLSSSEGYLTYLPFVVLNSQPRRQTFREVAEDWQWRREEVRAGCLNDIAGIVKGYEGPRWFWEGCAKGNDKTTGVGRRINWLLGYAKDPLQIYICSGSEDQASLITSAMILELQLNPWLQKRVKVTPLGGEGLSGSKLHVLPMRAATGQGIFPDYLVADEVTHWQHDEGKRFWDFVMASITKRPSCMFEVCTNAGHIGSWQWDVRKSVLDGTSPVGV